MTPRVRKLLRSDFREEWYAMRAMHAAPRKKRTPLQWAREERWLGQGVSPLAQDGPIRYNPDVMPWTIEPMDEAVSPDVQGIVLMWASGMAKTEIAVNIIGHAICEEPANVFVVYPKEDSRDKFSQDVIDRAIESTPMMRERVVAKKSRDVGNTIARKKYPGGSLFMTSAGSASNFRGPRAKIIFNDEPDGYPEDVDGEGDPILLSHRRSEGFENSVKIITGTPTQTPKILADGSIKYRSKIHQWYEETDKRKWFCPCRKCGFGQFLKFGQIREAVRKSGSLYYYLCESCDAEHTDRQRVRMVMDGQWRPTAPFTGWRGYWINAFSTTLPAEKGYKNKLHQFAQEAKRAAKSRGTKRVWLNTTCAEMDDPDSDEKEVDPPAHQPIIDNREDYAPDTAVNPEAKTFVPMKGIVLTTNTDVHGGRLEIEWRAWARDEESWGMGHFVLFGDTNRPEVWHEWMTHLQRKWDHESGGKIGLSLGLVDGGWRVDPIMATLRRLASRHVPGVSGKIIISKGVPQWQSVIHRTWATIKDSAKGIHIGTWCAKSLIYERLRTHSAKIEDRPSLGFMHFGKCYSPEFLRQIVSETSTFENVKGIDVETFKNPESNRNEGLDLLVGNLAAFRRNRWDFDMLEKAIHDSAKKDTQPEAPKASVMKGRGWSV